MRLGGPRARAALALSALPLMLSACQAGGDATASGTDGVLEILAPPGDAYDYRFDDVAVAGKATTDLMNVCVRGEGPVEVVGAELKPVDAGMEVVDVVLLDDDAQPTMLMPATGPGPLRRGRAELIDMGTPLTQRCSDQGSVTPIIELQRRNPDEVRATGVRLIYLQDGQRAVTEWFPLTLTMPPG